MSNSPGSERTALAAVKTEIDKTLQPHGGVQFSVKLLPSICPFVKWSFDASYQKSTRLCSFRQTKND